MNPAKDLRRGRGLNVTHCYEFRGVIDRCTCADSLEYNKRCCKGALVMPFSVVCHGCGQRLEVADDYSRRKMRCPECGVMCEIPVSDKERAATRSARAKSPAPSQSPPPELVPIPILEPEPPPVIPFMELETSEED